MKEVVVDHGIDREFDPIMRRVLDESRGSQKLGLQRLSSTLEVLTIIGFYIRFLVFKR